MITSAKFRAVSIGAHQLFAIIDQLNNNLCLGFWWWERFGALPNFSSDVPSIEDFDDFPSSIPHYKLAVNDEVLITNGWDPVRIFDGTTFRFAGAAAAQAPTVDAGGAGNLTGDYTAVYTYYDSTRDYETNPAATAPDLVTLASEKLSVDVVASDDSRFDKIRIYRNKNGLPGTYYRDAEVANADATVEIDTIDAALGSEVSYSNAQPPPVKYAAKTASRIFWAGSRQFRDGTATVVNGSATVILTEDPPPYLYTAHPEAPVYFQVLGGPRYGVVGVTGNEITLATTYKEDSDSGLQFNLCGMTDRVWYSDLTGSTALVKLESWNPENFFNIGVRGDAPGRDYGDEITGLRAYGNRIYAFCKESIWYFDPLINQRKRTGAVTGIFSQNTIAEDREGNLLFCGSDMQVYAFNGASSVMISSRVRNRFAEKERYNLDLMEHSFAFYDQKEGLYILGRPAYGSTLPNMFYIYDIYDDYTGKWVERTAPRLSAACRVRDQSNQSVLGLDTKGMVFIIDNYEDSSAFGNDKFDPVAMNIYTSVAGEISPGADRRGKIAVVFDSTQVKGSKIIISSATQNAATEDLDPNNPVTVEAGDNYIIGGWHGVYETGWIDMNEPDLFKSLHYIDGTFVKGSSGYLYISWYVDEDQDSPVGVVRVDAATERKFTRYIPARGQSFKLKIESVSELVGFAIREFNLSIHVQGSV